MGILLIYPYLSSFIKRDIEIFEILSERYELKQLLYSGKENLLELSSLVLQNDLNISWFVLSYATPAVMLSKMIGRKSILIAGGWDVVAMPEIDYGAMRDKSRIRNTTYALKNADKVLTVSNSLKEHVLRWVDREVDVVHLGFDSEEFKPSGEKEDLVITVANVSEDIIRLKGLETFIKCARALPEYKFAIIGAQSKDLIEHFKAISPENVEFTGFLPDEQLLTYYQRAKVYAQLSYQESFGSALAEAMLCECVPVTTKRGALPEVVGDVGFYVEYGDVDGTGRAMQEAMTSKSGNKARDRIGTVFPLEKRARRMTEIINEL
jgi:glycosyltransferase involved in cell wall biosynthesis